MRKTLFVLTAASLLSVGMASAQTQEGRTRSVNAMKAARPAISAQEGGAATEGDTAHIQQRSQPLPTGTHTVMYKDKTVYDFDADEVVGTMVSPDSVMVDGRLGPRFGSMLKPRASFQPELLKSVDSL